jgi:putative phosphoserine phosphatase/1-acylglycerol-3-phosphate O-acyltransferase
LLAEIGRQLDIPETVGTPLVLKNGRYTGASELPVCIGQGKVFRLQTHLGDDAIDWRHSFSYADSITDLPLLELAGSPVAVYPDAELATLARERNWDVID